MKPLTRMQFIKRAKSFHGTTYTYSKVKYTNRRTDVAIKCKKHGLFQQRPDTHTSGSGCPTCAEVHSTSQMESEWLDTKRISTRNRNQRLVIKGRVFNVDAYIPRTKTVYEFYGDLWHGNPSVYGSSAINPANGEKFGDLYARTVAREKVLKKAGYKVVSMWENDWKGDEQ
jgi:G:T-mismatch repair DNA endonuclease (very short patch repair protein)